MSSTVIRVPRIRGLPLIIAGVISIRSVVIAIPFTHHSSPARAAQSSLVYPELRGATSSRKTPRLSLASKSGLHERAKRRMAHPFQKQTRKGGAPSVVKLRVLHPPRRPLEGVSSSCPAHFRGGKAGSCHSTVRSLIRACQFCRAPGYYPDVR